MKKIMAICFALVLCFSFAGCKKNQAETKTEEKMFKDALAPMPVGDKYGFINCDGEMVLEPIYDMAQGFDNGAARVVVADEEYYIDKDGNRVDAPQVVEEESTPKVDAEDLEKSGKMRLSRNGSLYGFVDKDGKYVIEPIFAQAYAILGSSDWAWVVKIADEKHGQYGALDSDGNYIAALGEYDGVFDQPGSEYIVIYKDGKTGIMDLDGKVLMKPEKYGFVRFDDDELAKRNGIRGLAYTGEYNPWWTTGIPYRNGCFVYFDYHGEMIGEPMAESIIDLRYYEGCIIADNDDDYAVTFTYNNKTYHSKDYQ